MEISENCDHVDSIILIARRKKKEDRRKKKMLMGENERELARKKRSESASANHEPSFEAACYKREE